MSYTVKRALDFKDISEDSKRWMIQKFNGLNEKYEFMFNGWWEFPFDLYLSRGHCIWFCFNGEKTVGIMVASLTNNLLTGRKMLYQDHLSSDHPKATFLLLKEFIDFGRLNAKHVITCVGKNTNIKSKSLEKLGFQKLETLYSLED